MPCIEIADSIVQKGRETLERAMQLVERTREWGGRVVYGDTDSLFVLLKGKSKDEAFRIGREICDRVTADNPKPVKLKFEKVKDFFFFFDTTLSVCFCLSVWYIFCLSVTFFCLSVCFVCSLCFCPSVCYIFVRLSVPGVPSLCAGG